MVSSTDSFQALHAAWLSLDPGSTVEERISKSREAVVASHTSAAALHGMGDLLNDVPELNTARRKQTVRAMRLHRLPLTPDDVVLIDALPTTTPERTIADLVQSGHDLTHVANAIRDGHRSGILDLVKLREKLDAVSHRTSYEDGKELLENLLDLVGLSAAALITSTAKSPVGQLIATKAIQHYQVAEAIKQMMESVSIANLATPTLSGGVAETMKQMMESVSIANLATPTLSGGVAETIKQMMESVSIANLATPTLSGGVAETMKQMMESVSIANLATPTLSGGVAETMKQINGASRDFSVKNEAHKSLQYSSGEPITEREKS